MDLQWAWVERVLWYGDEDKSTSDLYVLANVNASDYFGFLSDSSLYLIEPVDVIENTWKEIVSFRQVKEPKFLWTNQKDEEEDSWLFKLLSQTVNLTDSKVFE